MHYKVTCDLAIVAISAVSPVGPESGDQGASPSGSDIVTVTGGVRIRGSAALLGLVGALALATLS